IDRKGARGQRAFSQPASSERSLRGGARILGPGTGDYRNQNPGFIDGYSGKSLVALSSFGVPGPRTIGFLSIERRVWFSRPIAGRDGVGLLTAAGSARANSACRRATIQRG